MGIFDGLAQNLGEVKDPVRAPDGHYGAIIAGQFTEHKAKSGNLALRYPVKLVEPGADIDVAELQEAGGLPEKKFNLDFWMSPDALFRFRDFAKSMGAADSLSLPEAAEYLATCGHVFDVELKTSPNTQDPTKPGFQNLDKAVGREG